MNKTQTKSSYVTIFARLLSNGKGRMSRNLARYVLTLGFTEEDQLRMTDLATRNQEGSLDSEGREELQDYVKASHLLALLHSKARKSLKIKVS